MCLSGIWICLPHRKAIEIHQRSFGGIEEGSENKVRRPLCFIGLIYIAAVMIGMVATVRGAPVYDYLDRQQVTVAGYVDWKEYRISGESEVLVITLKDAVILKEDQITNLEQVLTGSEQDLTGSKQVLSTEKSSNSEEISQQRIEHYWKENKTLLQQEDALGIEGVLCYMDQDTFSYEGQNILPYPEQSRLPHMGSLVMIQGTFYSFTHASNPGEFDSAEYYRILNQQGRVMGAECMAESHDYSKFEETLYQFREYMSLLIDACYDAQDASVMKAMLLGEKGTLDRDVKALYQQNGIIHILAISGLHLSIIGMGFYKLLSKIKVPILVDIIVSIAVMYCYGTMTGMGTSMTRAYIMFVLHLCAKLAGRTYDLYTALIIAALSVLLQQPLYLLHSGFLFSFGAVCGIGLFLPAVERNLFTKSRMEKLLLSGAAVSITTLPVYLCFYYEFPPYSVLLNLFVIPCMTLVLLGGLCCLVLAVCYLPLGMPASYPVHSILWLYEKSCDWCTKLPGHKWITGCPEVWQVVLFLGMIAGLIVWEHRMSKLLFWQGVLCALCLFTIRLPQGLEITMVDVGQGDCIYLSEDNGTRFLIDGGSSDKSDVAAYQILPFLKYKGVDYLNAVFVTHPDSDHENGIRAWLEGYEESGINLGMLILPDVDEESKNEDYRELEELAVRNGVPVHYIYAGEKINCGKVMLTCLHPVQDWHSDDTNAYSIVLYLTYGDFSALFTGDLEGEGERMVLDEIKRGRLTGNVREQITLLKVAHHGSRNSTYEEFLKAVKPRIALISAGEDNSYGHPHKETLERLKGSGAQTLITYEAGAITLRTDGKKVEMERFLEK